MVNTKQVFGIYGTSQQAEVTVDQLLNKGFEAWAITVMHPNNQSSRDFARRKTTRPPRGTDYGKTANVPLDGTLGIRDPGAGPIGGALQGALAEMGVPAEWYHARAMEGQVLLSVECSNLEGVMQATEVLKSTGADETGCSEGQHLSPEHTGLPSQ